MVKDSDYLPNKQMPDMVCLKCTGRGQKRPSHQELRLPEVALREVQMQQYVASQTSDKSTLTKRQHHTNASTNKKS